MPAAPSNRKAVFIVVGSLAALAFVGVLLVVSIGVGWYVWTRPYSRESFQHRFLGATAADVRGTLGAPERVDGPGNWFYRGVTADPQTGQLDGEVGVQFIDDRVTNIYYPPPTGAPARPSHFGDKDKVEH